VNDGGYVGPIHEIEVKWLAGQERKARISVRPNKPEYRGRFAVDVEGSGAGSQAKLGGARFGRGGSRRYRLKGGGSSPRFRQEGNRAGHGNAGRNDLPAG
jgi:hypothetical protein